MLKDLGYFHYTVNHSETFKNYETGFHTNNIEGTSCAIKKKIFSRQRIKGMLNKKHIEFIWRRKNSENLWDAFIESIRTAHIEDFSD